MTDAVAVRDGHADALEAWSPRDILAQVALIQAVTKEAMKEGEHYGVIPGTEKPTLLKPGAEKLGLTFRLRPDYETMPESILTDTLISYDVRCRLFNINTGKEWGSGLANCNSREERYAWRHAARKCPACGVEAIIKGKAAYGGGWVCFKKKSGCGAKYKDGDTRIESQVAGKIPNTNPWDLKNTILKMACKRSLVAAMLNATAASDMFTQDLEDTVPEDAIPMKTEDASPSPGNVPTAPTPKPIQPSHDSHGFPGQVIPAADARLDELWSQVEHLLSEKDKTKAWLAKHLMQTYQTTQRDKLSLMQVQSLVQYLGTL